MPYPDPFEVRLPSETQRLFPLEITAHVFEVPPSGYSEKPDFECIPAWGARLLEMVHGHAVKAKQSQLSRERIPLSTQTIAPDLLSQNAANLTGVLSSASNKLSLRSRNKQESVYNSQRQELHSQLFALSSHVNDMGINLNRYYESVLLGLLESSRWPKRQSQFGVPPMSFGGVPESAISVRTRFIDGYLPFATVTVLGSIIQIEKYRRQVASKGSASAQPLNSTPKIAV